MPELHDLLDAEARRQQPSSTRPFAALVAARRRRTRTRVASSVLLVVAAVILVGTHSGGTSRAVVTADPTPTLAPGEYVEPRPYPELAILLSPNAPHVVTEPYESELTSAETSVHWRLVSKVDEQTLQIAAYPGCNLSAVAQVRETTEEVEIRYVRNDPGNTLLCKTVATALLTLQQPLGDRLLVHAAETTGGTNPDTNREQVLGTLRLDGPLAGSTGLPGTVVFRDEQGYVYTAPTSADGAFGIQLPAGTFTVTGSSPRYGDGQSECYARTKVTIELNATEPVGPVIVSCSAK